MAGDLISTFYSITCGAPSEFSLSGAALTSPYSTGKGLRKEGIWDAEFKIRWKSSLTKFFCYRCRLTHWQKCLAGEILRNKENWESADGNILCMFVCENGNL